MKKKIYNGLLLIAMLFATMSSFVSCKDYDEDAFADLQGQNVTLQELINSEINALNGQIEALEQAQKECKDNCEAWKQEIILWQQYVEKNYVTLEEYNKHIAEYTKFIAENEAEHAALEKMIKDVEVSLLAANEALKKEMQEELLKVQTELNTLIVSLQTQLSNLTTTVENNKKELEKAIADNKAQLEKAIADNKAELEKAIADGDKALEEKINKEIAELEKSVNDTISNLEKRVAANEKAISNLNTLLSNLQNKVDGIQNLLNETIKDVVEAYTLAKNDSIRIDALEAALEALKEQHKNDNEALVAKVDSICNELTIIKKGVQDALDLANENLQKAKDYTDLRISEVMSEISNIKTTLSDLDAAYKAADAKLQDQIDELKKGLEDLTKRVEANEAAIDDLMEKYNDVDESLKQFITGILLQRTENPVFGSFSFPANIQTNILMAYYGYAGSYGVQFPTYYPRYYVRDNEVLTDVDIQMLGVTPTMLAEDGDAIVSSAGKVYVTVNPSNVNFEGQTLPIVNSVEEESGIKLSALKYSDKKITFGSTRSAVNGLYEAEATLDAADIDKVKMTFDLNAGELKETVKDIINPLDGINVTQVANTFANVLGQFNQELDAYALKASWTDELGVSRNVYSQYNLATTAIQPLGYGFMKDVNITSFPGFDKMQNLVGGLLDNMANKFKLVIPDFSLDLNIDSIKGIQFEKIDINTSNIDLNLKVNYKDTIKTTVEIKIDDYVDIDIADSVKIDADTIIVDIPVKGDVKDEFGNVVGEFNDTVSKDIIIEAKDILVSIQQQVPFKWTGTVPVEIPIDITIPVDMTEFQKLINEIEGMEDDINGMLSGQQDNINNIINTINSYLAQLGDLTKLTDKFANIDTEIDSAIGDIKDKIASYLDKIEDKLVSAVNSINKVLQPVMLVKTVDGFERLSQTIYNPTVMSAGDVQFIPTSYTAEVIAPAYKKLVGVTNVYSMDRSKNAQVDGGEYLTALNEANANEGVAEILDGDTQIVDFSAKKGYIYEVAYTSVDFAGMVVAKKFYVTVK